MKGDDIAERLLSFAAQVLRVTSAIAAHPEGKQLAQQLVRSGTAPGAHYEEARRAESKVDFVHKMRLAAKELGESVYWLLLASQAHLLEVDLAPVIREGGELTAILMASVRTARRRTPD